MGKKSYPELITWADYNLSLNLPPRTVCLWKDKAAKKLVQGNGYTHSATGILTVSQCEQSFLHINLASAGAARLNESFSVFFI